MKKYRERPGMKTKMREYMREYNKKPYVKKKIREWHQQNHRDEMSWWNGLSDEEQLKQIRGRAAEIFKVMNKK